ncbi:MAG: hypothetical protein EOP52_05395 [Sphingobacteriales bacterium]|nr:MAG: hypothetical protein EOP52_05395 [Sphingobacteriales bacterium]
MRTRKWIFIPFAIAALLLLVGGLVMTLWNAILPDLLAVKRINFWQATGLLVLCRILLGGWGGRGGGGGGWKGRMHNRRPPTPEERQRLKALWRERCRTHRNGNGPEV